MANSADRKVISYIADTKDVKRKLRELRNLNSKVSKSIGTNMSKGLNKVGKSLGSIKTTETKKGFKDLANTTTKASQSFKKLDGSLMQVTTTTRVNSKGIARTTTAYKDLDQNTVSLGQNISRLAKRAALTIPLWLALRGAMTGIVSTFKEGTKTLIEQDRAFQKAKRNLQGTTTAIESNFKVLQDAALELSLKTGESVSDITTAFQRFATTGLDFETSLAGANASVKASILLFGETEQIANAVARAYRILGGRTSEYASKGEELQAFLAQISELWKDNAFEIDEFSSAFERFSTQAKVSNISLKQTAILLSTLQTAGIRGSRAGRLLSTAVLQMNRNFDKFGKTLGINLKSTNSTFERLRMVTGAIDDLNKTNPVAASQAVSKLFRIRGGQTVQALAVMGDTLESNINKISNLKKFNAEFENQNKQLHRLVKQFKQINKLIAAGFVSGVVGGSEFNDTLILINDGLRLIQKNASEIAPSIGQAFDATGLFDSFTKAVSILKTIRPLVTGFNEGFDKKNVDKIIESFKKIPRSIIAGYSAAEKLSDSILNNLGITKELVKEEEKLTKAKKDQKDINEAIYNNISASPEQEQSLANSILSVKLQQLKTQGALNSQLLKAKSILIDRLGIEEKTIDKISRQLELEQSLSEEKRLQTRLGSESLQLFKIAKEHGVETAKRIGDVLSGDVDFSNFVRRGGEVVDIFKDKFANVFEQQQALSFFKGDTVPGLKDLRGGSSIAIQEKSIKGLSSTDAVIQMSKALSKFTALEKVQANIMTVNAQNVTVSGQKTTARPQLTTGQVPISPNIISSKKSQDLKTEVNLNFATGSFVLHGSASDKDAQLVEKAVKESIKQIDNRYFGKQTK